MLPILRYMYIYLKDGIPKHLNHHRHWLASSASLQVWQNWILLTKNNNLKSSKLVVTSVSYETSVNMILIFVNNRLPTHYFMCTHYSYALCYARDLKKLKQCICTHKIPLCQLAGGSKSRIIEYYYSYISVYRLSPSGLGSLNRHHTSYECYN